MIVGSPRRLRFDADRDWFNGALQETLQEFLGVEREVEDFKASLFGDYLAREDADYVRVNAGQPRLAELFGEYVGRNGGVLFPSGLPFCGAD